MCHFLFLARNCIFGISDNMARNYRMGITGPLDRKIRVGIIQFVAHDVGSCLEKYSRKASLTILLRSPLY